ncbi:thioredoxin family protein [Undibacterium sp.]|uniref:thioredoxin family protein n=1 Tax=Undibacterium sp. TaxID=1914977 RepID=UPI00260139FA|nr:thioredoxin family protein [Undibacterium sp.]
MKLFSIAIAVGLIFSYPGYAADQIQSAKTSHADIEWRKDNDVDAAFSLAKASNKPVFLYWGAVWCPPCNQVKATIFNRADFIDKSRHFVPVYLDGDSPGAQKLAARFKVRGYPTMILFKPDGSEITRLPGEVDGERYVQVLKRAMNASLSVSDTLKLALAGSKKLSAEDWSLLADYSWDDPEQKLISSKDVVTSLLRLSEACPNKASATRLYMKAIVISASVKPADAGASIDKSQALAKLSKALTDSRIARDNMDLFTASPGEVIELLTSINTESRRQLSQIWNLALIKLADDTSLSKTDRLSAISGQIAIASLAKAGPEKNLQNSLEKSIAQIERATTDSYERQSVVNAAAHALSDLDLLDASDALLKAELSRSHSAYYFMSSLGANAKKRGDKAGAINWYEQAYNAAKGPATRLQWGVSYVNGLIELAPQDEARIEKTAQQVLSEVASTENAFFERNRTAMERMSKKIGDWNKEGKHQAVMQKLRNQLDGICSKLPANDSQRASCQGLLQKS